MTAIELEAPPTIDGLRFRRYRGPDDLPGMLEANLAARDAYGVLDTISLEGMENQYRNLTNSDAERDILIVELGGRVVGYGRIEWHDYTDGSRVYGSVGLLRPELCGRGIGSAMLRWIERRQIEIAGTHEDDGRPRWHEVTGWDRDEYGTRLYRRHGYQPVRKSHEMVRPTMEGLSEATLPAGLEVRPVSEADLRRIFDAAVEAFADHWGEDDASESSFRRFAENPINDLSLWQIAFDGDEVAGLVLGAIDPADTARKGSIVGLVDEVAVRRPWRRRGLARALVLRTLRLLRERGATSAFLGVDGENPHQAMTLYEDCGFEVVSSETTWRKRLGAPGVRP